MTQFDNNSKTRLLQSIYQDQTYLLITPNQDKKVSFKGSIEELENALQIAANENAAIRHIIKKVANSNPISSSQVRFQKRESTTIN